MLERAVQVPAPDRRGMPPLLRSRARPTSCRAHWCTRGTSCSPSRRAWMSTSWRVRAEQALLELSRQDVAAGRFAELARELSNCPSGAAGGDLGWIGPQDCADELANELFHQKNPLRGIGLRPRLVHSRYGFHIVEVLGRKQGRQPPFEEVRERIAVQLAQQSRAKALHQYMQLLAGRPRSRASSLDRSRVAAGSVRAGRRRRRAGRPRWRRASLVRLPASSRTDSPLGSGCYSRAPIIHPRDDGAGWRRRHRGGPTALPGGSSAAARPWDATGTEKFVSLMHNKENAMTASIASMTGTGPHQPYLEHDGQIITRRPGRGRRRRGQAAALQALARNSGLRPWRLGNRSLLPVVQGGMGVGISAGGPGRHRGRPGRRRHDLLGRPAPAPPRPDGPHRGRGAQARRQGARRRRQPGGAGPRNRARPQARRAAAA